MVTVKKRHIIPLCSLQIWGVCDSAHSGSVSRDGFYKSLALTSLAQQGKNLEEKNLSHYEGTGEEGGEGRRRRRGGEGRGGRGGEGEGGEEPLPL